MSDYCSQPFLETGINLGSSSVSYIPRLAPNSVAKNNLTCYPSVSISSVLGLQACNTCAVYMDGAGNQIQGFMHTRQALYRAKTAREFFSFDSNLLCVHACARTRIVPQHACRGQRTTFENCFSLHVTLRSHSVTKHASLPTEPFHQHLRVTHCPARTPRKHQV